MEIMDVILQRCVAVWISVVCVVCLSYNGHFDQRSTSCKEICMSSICAWFMQMPFLWDNDLLIKSAD